MQKQDGESRPAFFDAALSFPCRSPVSSGGTQEGKESVVKLQIGEASRAARTANVARTAVNTAVMEHMACAESVKREMHGKHGKYIKNRKDER